MRRNQRGERREVKEAETEREFCDGGGGGGDCERICLRLEGWWWSSSPPPSYQHVQISLFPPSPLSLSLSSLKSASFSFLSFDDALSLPPLALRELYHSVVCEWDWVLHCQFFWFSFWMERGSVYYWSWAHQYHVGPNLQLVYCGIHWWWVNALNQMKEEKKQKKEIKQNMSIGPLLCLKLTKMT